MKSKSKPRKTVLNKVVKKGSRSDHFLTLVLPCLNEAETLSESVRRGLEGIRACGIEGEVIVADNGSTDASAEIARKAGARVVFVPQRGYGAALAAGFAAAKGDLLAMGDADNTYDFRELPSFYAKYLAGYEFISGNRLNSQMESGAMPWLHQFIGVPALTLFLNIFFPTGIWDGHCGMRLFSRSGYERLELRSPGMEFASEMLIRASQEQLRMTQVPIRYGARHTKSYSKLNTFRDGFRHLWLILRAAIENHA